MNAYKKFIVKNILYIVIILLFASLATYKIYDMFKDNRGKVDMTKSLEVKFPEQTKDEINITKSVAVTDAIGLSSRSYKVILKNNGTTAIKYDIKVEDNDEKIKEDGCIDRIMPHKIIKGSYHKKKLENHIFMLNELIDETLVSDIIKPNEAKTYSFRFWVTGDQVTEYDNNLHFHGKLKVIEK